MRCRWEVKKSDAGNRKCDAGNRKSDAGNEKVKREMRHLFMICLIMIKLQLLHLRPLNAENTNIKYTFEPIAFGDKDEEEKRKEGFVQTGIM